MSKFADWFLNTNSAPVRNMYLATAASFTVLALNTDPEFARGEIGSRILAFESMLVGATAGIATLYYQIMHDKNGDIPKQEYYGLAEKIMKQLESQEPPQPEYKGETRIKVTLGDILYDVISPFMKNGAQRYLNKAKKEKNPYLALRTALHFFGEPGKLDQGYLSVKDAYDWLEGKKPKLSLFAKIYHSIFLGGVKLARLLHPIPRTYLGSAAIEAMSNPEQSWRYSQAARMFADEIQKNQLEAYLLHAILSTAQRRPDQQKSWTDATELMMRTGKPEYLGESRNPVWILKNSSLLTNAFVFKGNTQQKLEQERQATITLETIMGEEATIPKPLHITEKPIGDTHVYIMTHLNGETLYEKLQAQDKTAMPEVVKVLAKIHARYPTTQLPRLDLEAKIKESLKDPDFGLPEDQAKSILASLSPVLNAILDTATWAMYKDAHPQNWIVGNKIGIIDCEIQNQAPITLDLANLLAYGNFFTTEEELRFVQLYMNELNKEGITTHQKIMPAYYNGVIFRMLRLASVWSSPLRAMKKHRLPAIITAINAIARTEQTDPEYYLTNAEDYRTLKTELEQLKEKLQCAT